jgi:hypothetical protein
MAESPAEDKGPGQAQEAAPGNGAVLLPEPVRLRALALAADALGQVPADQVPARLRPVASFAPARRARLGGTQIAAVLETDGDFRDRVATQVRAAVPALASALDDGQPPPAADPVELAAVAYLLQSKDWEVLVDAARAVRTKAPTADEQSGAVERLQGKLRDTRAQLRAAQNRAKDQVAEVKRENAELRRKLADARQRLAQAEDRAREASEAQQAAEKDSAALAAETRRLRARVSELEASSAAARRSVRDEREMATLRTRLLLDTLRESVHGLRRELGLPHVEGSPADSVPGALPKESGTPGRGGMALATDDPALLDELLALPRVHLIVDGYNVTKTAWPSLPLESQRTRLVNGLAPVVARSRAEVTVVFDGADLVEPPLVAGPRGVRVKFSPSGVIADDLIRDLLAAEPEGRPVVVVSSDREVADAAKRARAYPVESVALVRLLSR